MINKIYDKIKFIIKENYKYVLILIFMLLVLNYPLDYTVMVSGGTIDINDRIEIEDSTDSKGSFNLAYVTELRGTIPSLALSYIIPDWTRVPIEEYQVNKNETKQDIITRAKIYLEYSRQAAIKVAYESANKKFNASNNKFYIVYKSEESDTNVKIGDILLQAENTNLTSLEQFKEIIESKNVGDTIKLTVQRNEEKIQTDIKVKEIDKEKLTGISILNLYKYETNPKIDLRFNDNESGSSGGLMLALAIYDKLVEYDLTNGLKIVGTGTIDFYGNVGQIDGVKYKLKGAVNKGADVFLAPSGKNYKECVELKNKNGYNIKIIEVKHFDDAIRSLKQLYVNR